MTDWTPEKFIERATNVGEDTRKYIINILENASIRNKLTVPAREY